MPSSADEVASGVDGSSRRSSRAGRKWRSAAIEPDGNV
uniref:Uncharacterized protein n=1 Tax=Arundo donax TaxID=35708 RepID=A0A0A9ESD7_ARUDO